MYKTIQIILCIANIVLLVFIIRGAKKNTVPAADETLTAVTTAVSETEEAELPTELKEDLLEEIPAGFERVEDMEIETGSETDISDDREIMQEETDFSFDYMDIPDETDFAWMKEMLDKKIYNSADYFDDYSMIKYTEELDGKWKIFIQGYPKSHDEKSYERYCAAEIITDDDGLTFVYKPGVYFDPETGANIAVFDSEDFEIMRGEWTADSLAADIPGKENDIQFFGFWTSGDKQYGLGAFSWKSGERTNIGFVRDKGG